MRRIKLILAATAAVAVLMVMTAAPAMADEFTQSAGGNDGVILIGGTGGSFEVDGIDTDNVIFSLGDDDEDVQRLVSIGSSFDSFKANGIEID